MIAVTYLMNLFRNVKVHGVSIVSSKEHLELPPILTDATELLVLLSVLVHDEREKCHASPLRQQFQGVVAIYFTGFLLISSYT